MQEKWLYLILKEKPFKEFNNYNWELYNIII